VAAVVCGLLGVVPFRAVSQTALQQGPLIGVTSSTQNPLQVGLLHWYDANLATTFGGASSSYAVAFDGANVWVTDFFASRVSKL
jgi:hypothetical protein